MNKIILNLIFKFFRKPKNRCRLVGQTKLFNRLKESFPKEEILFEVGNKIVPWLIKQRFDIYFPKYNIAVEYNGKQHYVPIKCFGGRLGFEKQKYLDTLKKEKCKNNNCYLFEVRYDYNMKDYSNLINNINKIIASYEN